MITQVRQTVDEVIDSIGPQIRLMYAAGPGNVIDTYFSWKQGEDDPSQLALTYSGQFYDVCRINKAQALIISSHSDKRTHHDGGFELRHLPKPFPSAQGIYYHAAHLLYGLQLVYHAFRFRPDYFVVAEGSTHWFVLFLLKRRTRIIASIHCLLWLQNQRPGLIHRILNRPFFQKRLYAVMSVSNAVAHQIVALAGDAVSVLYFLPTYRRNTFRKSEPPSHSKPFRVLYMGRIEENKGVFTFLEAACRLRTISQDLEFDVCGDGSALATLQKAAREQGLDLSFRCHGHCDRGKTSRMFAQCHVVVVPTSETFNEGFNKVVVEAVLAGRPFITSAACPALSYVYEAGIEVPVNNSQAYASAVLELFESPELYKRKQTACSHYAAQFYDHSKSWSAALQTIISSDQKIE